MNSLQKFISKNNFLISNYTKSLNNGTYRYISSNNKSNVNNINTHEQHLTKNIIKLSEISHKAKYKILRENNNPSLMNPIMNKNRVQNNSNKQKKNTDKCNSEDEQQSSYQIEVGGSRTRFQWIEQPKTVLIIKKHKDKKTTMWLNTISQWLHQQFGLRVLVEPNVYSSLHGTSVGTYTEEDSHNLGKVVDFVITLGGDGTLLHVSSLFKEEVPPIISFHLGTLGFLMPFKVEDYQDAIKNIMSGEFLCTNRMRLICDIHHQKSVNNNSQNSSSSSSFQVLNEVTLHRGSNPHSTTINCIINGHVLSDIVGDGLIVATATGSTAYSLSCGGPLVHPCINCILITPIAPSSYSSKPSLLPDDSILTLNISQSKGKSISATFDGTKSIKVEQGDYLVIKKSLYPLLTINKTNETTDWVHGNGKLIEMSDKSSIWNQSIYTTSAN
ncbi:NAD+ kinase family protein [Tieghemostelium lacteum]|uniref:NAD+ kinase family protein n=1 Tax=Tieghemostelium lacteum TaxID=361077 RepID=A0A151ZB65_TIELA|nr:NAD+ kinase family protein [Tieghemostelium lacteum]|eukprot:KYQ91192.1 NAD+ kinase family protein [Tieghemostelium lacteum]